MSDDDRDGLSDFERQLRTTLRDSVDHLDGATRSRLTRARHAALDEAQRRQVTAGVPVLAGDAGARFGWFTRPGLLPAGVAAAALLAVVLVLNQGGALTGADPGAAGAFQDIELLADSDAIALSQEEDYEFLEWAAAVVEPSGS